MAVAQASPACLRALRPLTAGEIAVLADFEPAACADAPRAFSYDRAARVARLRRDVATGEVVRGSTSTLSAVRPGQGFTLQAHVGPVIVERRVEVAWPARAGELVMVRGAEGELFAAPSPETAP
jgi:hypothetical protein